MGEAMTRVYREGVLEADGFPLADVSDYLEQSDTVVWVDLCGPSMEQLHELADELSLHELAVEDALSAAPASQARPVRDPSVLVVPRGARRRRESRPRRDGDRRVHQSRWLITVRKNDLFSMKPVLERWDRSPDLAKYGVSFLLYGLLDVVIDSYFEAVQTFDEYYDEVSEGIFAEHPLDPSQMRHWFDMRRAMVRFHRLVVPMREAISSLMRTEQSAVAEELYPYFQDVYDHILRVTESSDSLRDLVSTIVETNLSLRDYRQNQIVKKVSSWAAIIAVPAFITGYYGMNVPYPGYLRTWGVVTSTTLIFAACGALYLLFKRIDWL